MTHAVVLGGGMAGMLAAAALAGHVDRVTVIENDRFPDEPAPRRGLPQGHHFHMFMGGGVAAMDDLLPGMSAELYAAGAHRRRLGDQFLGLSANGWSRPYEGPAYVLGCSRALLDHGVRRRVLADERITLLDGTKALGLVGSPHRVSGVRVASRADQDSERGERRIAADFVVDATGRGSRAPEWLVELGSPRVAEESQDAGFAYAGRRYLAPDGAGDDFPAILSQAEAGTGVPGRGAGVLPNENGTWIVSMIGTRGAHPPTDEAGYLDFARSLPDPLIAELMQAARPLTDIRAYRGLVNRRRRFDLLPAPAGFLVVGDAATTLNPNYATGMSIAALGSLELRGALAANGPEPAVTRAVQKALVKVAAGSWQQAITNDSWFPGSESTMKIRGAGNGMRRFMARWNRVLVEHPDVARTTFEVGSFVKPQSALMSLPLLTAVVRGPRRPTLTLDAAMTEYPTFRDALTPLGIGRAPGVAAQPD